MSKRFRNFGLFVMFVTLYAGMAGQTALADDVRYLVVLGSYQDRAIAVDQVQKFQRQREQAELAVVVKQSESGRIYRVVGGSAPYSEALSIQKAWQAVGVRDAWLTRGKLPEIRRLVDDIAESTLANANNSPEI